MTHFCWVFSQGVMGVSDLDSYRGLYNNCANLVPDEKQILISDLESLVADETCQVETSTITSAGAEDGQLPPSATQQCVDDDAALQTVFGELDHPLHTHTCNDPLHPHNRNDRSAPGDKNIHDSMRFASDQVRVSPAVPPRQKTSAP